MRFGKPIGRDTHVATNDRYSKHYGVGRRGGGRDVNDQRLDRPRTGFLKHLPPHLQNFLRLLQEAWTEYERDRANYLATAMIYYALISLVPLLVVLLSALGLLLTYSTIAAELQQRMLSYVESALGAGLRETIEDSLISFRQ